jgi:hypothetical protein
MPIGKIFEISLEVDGGEASLAGVKIYSYSHADDATVSKSAFRRHDQFNGTLYTAKIVYPAGQVPGNATNLGDLVAVAKAAVVDIFGKVFAEPKVEAPVVEATPASAVEAKTARGGRGKKVEEAPAVEAKVETSAVEATPTPAVEAKVETSAVEATPTPAVEAKVEAPVVEGAGTGEAEVIAEAEELQSGDK